MPSSRAIHIPAVLNLIRKLKPNSILDVGTGFGKWGMLFREYTDVIASESEPDRYGKPNWRVRIDGVEGFPEYLTPVHDYVYDHVYIGDMREVADQIEAYDVVFLGDVIEHVSREDGEVLLRKLRAKARQAVILSTPAKETHQGDLCNNPLERHRSLWRLGDFTRLGASRETVLPDDVLVAVFPAPGVAAPRIKLRSRRAGVMDRLKAMTANFVHEVWTPRRATAASATTEFDAERPRKHAA